METENARIEQPCHDLSKRIIGWTNNLIATSIVIVLAMVVGRQLAAMWTDPSDGPIASVESSVATGPEYIAAIWPALSAAAETRIEFGEGAYQMIRQEVLSRGKSPADLLQQCCQSLLRETPTTRATADIPPATELQLLDQLQQQTPIAQQPGQWQLWRPEPQSLSTETAASPTYPILVGTREGGLGAQHSCRLALVGMALPGQSDPTKTDSTRTDTTKSARERNDSARTITLIVFQKTGDGTVNQLPIPPGCQRTLTIASAAASDHTGGSQLVGFHGGTQAAAKSFFETWAATHGWVVANPWQQTGNTFSQSFSGGRNLSNIKHIRVELSVDAANNLRGLLVAQLAANTSHTPESTTR